MAKTVKDAFRELIVKWAEAKTSKVEARLVRQNFEKSFSEIVSATQGMSEYDRERAIAALAKAQVDLQRERNNAWLWRPLVLGLILILCGSVAAIWWLASSGNDQQYAVTVFTTALSGLLGLFVRPPHRPFEDMNKNPAANPATYDSSATRSSNTQVTGP
ncbi:hypothetical protein [Streptomyces sp. NPDC001500]